MKACVIHGQHRLCIEDRKMPVPNVQEVAIRFGAGGICGSDLHYYNTGRVGAFVVREPMILGHEVAGDVIGVGPKVTKVAVGDRVAVNPSRPCGVCRECRSGKANLCANVLFFGSAARFPHVQGAFAEVFLADQTQCVPIGENLPYVKAACAEPLAVALHAVKRAGNLLGKRVLIAGAGPIGLLVLMVARLAGSAKVVLTDQFQEPLETARRLGADQVINIAEVEKSTRELAALAGTFDIAIEAAGALPALSSCLTSVCAGGRIVQLGILPDKGDERFRLSMLTTREIELVGSFRFFDEYETAVELLRSKMVDPSLIVTAEIPIAEAETAFLLASDRKKALKVCLTL